MRDMAARLDSSVKAFVEKGAGPLAQLETYFGSYDRALEKAKALHPVVVKRLAPWIRVALANGFARSGLNKDSERGGGQLYEAAVTNARIEAGSAFDGIFISIASGYSSDVYKRAGAFEYGSVRGLGAGKSAFKTAFKRNAGGPQAIKAGGVKFRPPKPFFNIDGGVDLESLYCQFLQEEIDKMLGGSKA